VGLNRRINITVSQHNGMNSIKTWTVNWTRYQTVPVSLCYTWHHKSGHHFLSSNCRWLFAVVWTVHSSPNSTHHFSQNH